MAQLKANEAKFRALAERIGQELRVHHAVPGDKRDARCHEVANQLDRESMEASRNSAQQQQTHAGMQVAISIRSDEYLGLLISRQTALMDQINIVMSLARADVGLGGDVEKLKKQSHEMSARTTAALKKLKEEHEKETEAMTHLYR